MPNEALQVEADQFAHRVVASGFTITDVTARTPRPTGATNIIAQIAVHLSPLILPDVFAAGEHQSVNVRIANTGTCTLSSRADPPLYIAYFWHGPSGEAIEGGRTHLLIDLPPGRAITLPVMIVAPSRPGAYRLEIAPVLETVTWFRECAALAPIRVEDNVAPSLWSEDLASEPLSYSRDHDRALAILESWIGKHISAPEPIILEIGGNFNPMTSKLRGGIRFNLDVDAHGLMCRNIVGSGAIRSIVADGFDLPFADHSLDVIAMFAAFHHFPEPISLLRHLAQKVKVDGLVCLMCEPIGHVMAHHNYEGYIHELQAGVNEQSFQVWEYVAMLEAAGLQIVDATFDRGSAKIAARPL
jgi:SAM-dependent methyltransferase